jgi:acyl-CoA synthetase (AMP-forming)/AMP-acid ligase II
MSDNSAARLIDQWRARFEPELLPPAGAGGPRFRRREQDLVSLLLARAAAHPSRPCLTDGLTGDVFRYGDVEHRVLVLAQRLGAEGFGPGDRLALIDPPSPSAVIVLFAALAAGGTAVPINERLHPNELNSLVASVRPRVVATSRAGDLNLTDDVVVVHPASAVAEAASSPAPSSVDAPDPTTHAVVLHTGGTTGAPKSVVLTHDAVTQNLTFFRVGLGLSADDRALVASPLFHVTGLMAQVLHMLELGGESVLLPRFETRNFLDTAAATRATYSCVVPTMVRMLVQDLADRPGGDSLRMLLYGGAPMDPPTLERFAARLPHVGLVNTYGATETCGSATFLPPELALAHPTSVGFESPIVEFSLDGTTNDDAFVERGVIAMRGASTSAGYLTWNGDTPTVTPFPARGWSSGDDGGRDSQGLLYILGRVDDIVNRGGEKIHPEEIERYLLAHDAVAEAAVCGVPDEIYGQEMLAVVVPRSGQAPSEDDLRAHLAQFVGRFKVPRYVRVTAELPRTAAGKINKRQIAAEMGPPAPATSRKG